MAFSPELLPELVAVILMVAPSASDNHVENFSEPAAELENFIDCKTIARSFNLMNVEVFLEENGPVTIAYAWCKPKYEGD